VSDNCSPPTRVGRSVLLYDSLQNVIRQLLNAARAPSSQSMRVRYRVDRDFEHFPPLSFGVHDYIITMLPFVATVVDVVDRKGLGLVTLSGQIHLGFFLCRSQVGAGCGHGGVGQLSGWISWVREGAFDNNDKEIIASHDAVDDRFYQEVGGVVADWSAFRSLDGDSDCDYSVR
jgi:hypothetical protein